MPLLRLLHQITNMYQNVKEAQNELREQPGNRRVVPQKDESSLGKCNHFAHNIQNAFIYFSLKFHSFRS